MISATTKTALSSLFEMGVEYMTLIQHNENRYFIILGNTSIFFLKEGFDILEAKVSFQCIDRLIVSSQDIYLLQIHFNAKRPKNVPLKMNIHSLERRDLIKFIQQGWKTDYMHKFLEVRELPTYKGKFRDYNYQVTMLKKPQVELMENQEMYKYNMHMLNGYNIFFPNSYQNTKKGLYRNGQNKSQFTLQVSETNELEVLEHMHNHIDIQYYAEYYVHNALAEEEKYWITHSAPYFKRRNLYNDLAEWKCWQTRAKVIMKHQDEPQQGTKKKKAAKQIIEMEYAVIMMRRKYHPPYLENFVDIVLTFLYDPKCKVEDKNPEAEQEQQELEDQLQESENEEDGEEEKKNAGEAYIAAFKQLYSDYYWLNIMRDAADSIYASDLKPMDPIYKGFIQLMADSLVFDEDWMFYVQQKHQITPKIREILVIPIIQGFKILFNKSDNEKELDQNKRPAVILEGFRKSTKNQFSELKLSDKQKQEKDRIYIYKVSRYLASQLDGGYDSSFKFKTIMKAHNNYKDDVLKIFDFCLYSVSEQSGVSNDFIIEEVSKKFPKIAYQKYIFNERVMISFLDTDLFKEELLKKDQQQLYIDLLMHLLIHGKTTKLATCKHIITYHSKDKEQITEQIINLQKGLISPLLIVYQSDHPMLSTYACVALYNMCANSKEFKYQIMKENGIALINSKLSTNNQNVLLYTLKLIFSLMTIVQNIEAFLQLDIMNTLIGIIQKHKGFALYSAQVLAMCFKIYTKCISRDMDLRDKLDLFFQVVVLISDVYFVEIKDVDFLKAEAINTIFKICHLNIEDEKYLEKVQNGLMPYIIQLLQVPIEYELQQSIVKLMCLMIDKRLSFRDQWEVQTIVPIIEKFESHDPPINGADFLLKQLLLSDNK
ncbi:unnamed protein product [Paramecium primaurelia]|uniref:Uncharacterized protein n=1 Tax=Paramecium primaurelia TaxID=5886 RepID=A0A8S1NYX2_PARPR|nr:unnamed protein product [Paramecium primaurelia]